MTAGKRLDNGSMMARIWKYAAMLLFVLTLGVGQMWGVPGFRKGNIYFDKSGWTDNSSSIQFVVGKSNYSSVYNLGTTISNTQLVKGWCSNGDNWWNGMSYFAVVGNGSGWGSGDWGSGNLSNASHYTGTNNSVDIDNSEHPFLCTKASASNGAALTISEKSSLSGLNYTLTMKYAVSNNGGTATELTSGYVPATITVSTYKFTNNYDAVSSSSLANALTKNGSRFSSTADAAHTASTTFAVSSIDGDYAFLGWYTAADGGTELSTSESYTTYLPTANATIYARFSHENNHTVTVSYTCASPSATVSTATTPKIGEVTYSSQTAPTVAGYTFVNWTLGTGLAKHASDELTSNPIRVKTNNSGSGYTLTANYTEDLSSPYTLKGGTNLTGNNWSTVYNLTKKSGHSTESVAYYTFSVGSTNSGTSGTADDWSFKLINSGTWYGLAADEGSSYWWQRNTSANRSLSTSGKNIQICADVAGDYEVKVDYSTPASPTVTVTFPTKYSVTYSVSPSAAANAITTSPSVSSGGYVAAGTSVTFTHATAKTGYTWYRWENGSGSNLGNGDTYTATINANTTVVAKYNENTYNVSASASPAAGGSVTPTSATSMGQVNGGDITASNNPGYSFTSWAITTGSGYFGASGTATTSTTANTTFRPTAVSTLTATFSEVMRTVGVTVNNSYLGSVSAASLTNVGPATKSAEVTATAETGASFTNWTLPSGVTAADGYSATSNPIKVNATAADKTITANFTETKYTVSMSTADASKGTVGAASASVGQITAVAITATPKSGYMFSKWVKTSGSGTVTYYTGAGNGQVTDASGEEKETTYICVTGDVTLQATWEADRSSGYVVYYGNDGKNADGGTDASQTRAWKDGKLYRPTTEASDVSYFTFTAGVADVDKVIEFKIHKKTSPEAWYGYNSASGGKVSGNISSQTLSTDYGNGRLCITMPGNYVFTWNKSNNQLSITYPTNVYYLRGGFNSWSWTHPMTETSSGVYSATVSMTEANHTYSGDNGFKLLIAGQYYGKNSTTVTRSTSTGSAAISSCSTSGGNIGLTTDYTGDYTFTYTVASNTLQVTYPTAYKVTFGKGSVNGTTGSFSAVNIDNGNSAVTSNSTWVKSGHRVTFTAPSAKGSYEYLGWYTVATPSGADLSANRLTTETSYTASITSSVTYYACYAETRYTVSVSSGGNGTVSPTTVYSHIATASGDITATPATGYKFDGWTLPSGTSAATGYTASSNPIRINATSASKTITANFSPIWSLAGGEDGGDNWAVDTYKFTTYSENAQGHQEGSIGIDLPANSLYWVKLYNLGNSEYNGLASAAATTDVYYNTSNTGWSMTNASGNQNLYIHTAAAGTYTFYWDIETNTLYVSYPTSWFITSGISDASGGSFTAEDDDENDVTGGKFVADNSTVTFTASAPNTGYTFEGWYSDDTYTSAYEDNNSDINLSGDNNSVLELSSITANKAAYAKFTANTYTITFDATTNGGSCATASKSVTYASTYGDLPVATHAANTFIGWYTTASGEGDRITSETVVSITADQTLYARFESTYTVNVQYKCGSVVLYPGTTVNASSSSLAADINAPEILGYNFVNWTGDNATFGDAGSATTTVNVTSATTITANYSAVPTVYFKNNLGWDTVYVTFDCYFDGSRDNAPGNYGKPYYGMTRLENTDIYSCVIPSYYTSNDYEHWAWNIAFDNKGFASSEHVGTQTGAFASGEFLGRADFDPNATMYIPYDGDTETRNGGTYYPTGCWIQYNSNYSGYKVKVNTYIQGSGGIETFAELCTDIAGSTEFTCKVNLTSANYTYGVMLYKEYQKNNHDLWYTNVNDEANTITAATTSLPWAFQPCTDSWQRCRVKTEALGEYEFTVSFATGKPMVDVTYPVSVGDWRLVYKDLSTWSNGAHTADWAHASRVLKAKANAEDLVSFYVAYGSTPSVELQKCTAIDGETGAQTWEKQGDNISLSSITAKGVYNFKVTQNESKVASAAYDGVYDGDFYIRTDASDGGWANYKDGENTMTYSEYSIEHGDYTHYFMSYRGSGTNIKFVIANDYSPCISDTLGGDTYTGNSEWLPAAANTRFMWNMTTNTISRAYLSGSSIISDRFLVLEGDDKMYDEDGNALAVSGLNVNEMNFIDDQNWIYEATVQAQPNARIKLTAKYNNKIQYFYGTEGDRSDETTDLLIGGVGSDLYKIRVVYDFKTNRLMKAFMPNGDITTDLSINADLMIIREAQGDAQQITFNGGSLSTVKTVYGAMKFNKWNVNDKAKDGGHNNLGWSRYKRDIFYISFPFEVKLSDVFGFGTYGTHWIIEYYDGKGRAKNGFWADTESYWKFVQPSQRNSFTLKAFEGYILALDLDEMTESSSIWSHGVEDVYIYFPSSGNVGNISATNRTVTIDQVGYECKIGPRFDGGDDRTKKDSYWHVIGVPSFANYNSDLKPTSDGSTIDWHDDDGVIDWSTPSLPYLYEWNSSDNSLTVTSSATFNFKAMYSYMVQYAGTSIYWSTVNVTPSSVAARHEDRPTNTEFRLELQKDEQKADQTFIRMTNDENVTIDYDFNYDLSKEFKKNQANIYTLISSVTDGVSSVTQTAGNCLPMSEQTTVVPVGVKLAADGDYTFSIPDGTSGIGVTLIDSYTGMQTNLSALDYTVSLESGTYDDRFLLQISPIHTVPTEVEVSEIGDQTSDVRKLLIDGLMYIVRDGKMYDARGARVE